MKIAEREREPVAAPGSAADEWQEMLVQAQRRLVQSVRRLLMRLLVAVAETALLAIVSLIVLIAGIWRLGDALSLLIAAWLGSPGLGELVTGAVLVVLALGGLYIVRRPLAKL